MDPANMQAMMQMQQAMQQLQSSGMMPAGAMPGLGGPPGGGAGQPQPSQALVQLISCPQRGVGHPCVALLSCQRLHHDDAAPRESESEV